MPPRSRTSRFLRRLAEVVACSLAVTALGAIAGLAWHLATGTRWALAFVIARWILIAGILLLPVLHARLVQRDPDRRGVPWALRTPWTPLLLVCESVVIDIVSARLHG